MWRIDVAHLPLARPRHEVRHGLVFRVLNHLFLRVCVLGHCVSVFRIGSALSFLDREVVGIGASRS